MIKTVSDLLKKLIDAENLSLKSQDVSHAPTIGDMYEGLTQSVLDKALPTQSSIDVSTGFIVDDAGNTSDELDCLIVSGEGQSIPYTDKRKYPIDDVVAVIQVKKNLYSSDLIKGYKNLRSVMKFTPTRSKRADLFTDAFQSITRRHLPPREDVVKLPFEIQMIYHALMTDFVAPSRIILGYNGFKSHSAFRDSFVGYLSAQADGTPKKGFGPTSFPDLVVCGQWSLAKCNGMPFIGPIENDLFWPFYCSASTNPVELLLQIIWTRLVYDDKLDPVVFDDDMLTQSFARFLSTKCMQLDNGVQGWAYNVTSASDDDLRNTGDEKPWEPSTLDLAQFVIMNRLCAEDVISLLDPSLHEFLTKNGYTVERFVASLSDAGLAGRDGDSLRLLTRGCTCAILPDGRFVAGENVAGQLTRYVARFMDARKAQQHAGQVSSGAAPSAAPNEPSV